MFSYPKLDPPRIEVSGAKKVTHVQPRSEGSRRPEAAHLGKKVLVLLLEPGALLLHHRKVAFELCGACPREGPAGERHMRFTFFSCGAFPRLKNYTFHGRIDVFGKSQIHTLFENMYFFP